MNSCCLFPLVRTFLLFCLALADMPLIAQPILAKVAYPQTQDINDPIYYYQQLLILALEKTRDSHGDYQIVFADKLESVARTRQLVQAGDQANLIWGSVTPDRAQSLLVVPFDILRGYNNFRLLLISSKNRGAFVNVKTRDDFHVFKAGNGANWTDTRILRVDGIKVITAVNFDSLLKMLVAGRFDYISRGSHEIHYDVQTYGSLGFPVEIDGSILLQYQRPVSYNFLVNPQNKKLAERLTAGLQMAEADGSFIRLFNRIPAFQRATVELAKERVKITIDNTQIFLPED